MHVEVIDTSSQYCWQRGVLSEWRLPSFWKVVLYSNQPANFQNSQLRIWVNDVYTCPRGHPLELEAVEFECECDKCGRGIADGEEVYTCPVCNYDVCPGCEDNSLTVSKLLRLRLTRRDVGLCYRDTEQWLCFRKMPFAKMPFDFGS